MGPTVSWWAQACGLLYVWYSYAVVPRSEKVQPRLSNAYLAAGGWVNWLTDEKPQATGGSVSKTTELSVTRERRNSRGRVE